MAELKKGPQASLPKVDTSFNKTSGFDKKSTNLKAPDLRNLNLNSIKK